MTSPTLSDVARAAGVSYATADRVINNRGNVAEKSISKVREAVSALGYVRNVAAANLSRGRIYRLAFLIPRGSNAFFNRIRQHIEHTANHQASERVSAEVIEVAAFAVDGLQDSITDLLMREFDGVAIVGLQSAALEVPLAELRAKGVAVVGLVSDLPHAARAAYIGIDNIAAGRTAGRMVGLAHGGQGGKVQTFAGSLNARDHAERLAGFREVLNADFPQITLLDPIMTKDDAQVLQAQTQEALIQQGLTALYNVGAGNSGLIAALRGGQGTRPFCVVHELVAHSRQALMARQIDLVIDQRPDVEINRAFTVLRALIDAKDLPPMPDLVPTIYVRDNLPADTLTDKMKAQDT
ncbi:HTH-type transcriptional regulator DegA (plasmid) [Sulfitobacter sp. DSM 110093]|uniref:LacI family DNA-binding transcriptional regulator n=1 Tax=Sulfitobacter sp. DSM 110093 TaxID=2883127 RepID=UPI001FACE6AE|nr:LacI family DNA-binding transcriptional regulator [Sulfitobacter sp. DSM 110093]UOA34248.1 HTH-type transcriptional regulator DegA [Sulfitobacter sp. DSM 110093]